MTVEEAFGEVIRALRKNSKLTFREITARSGMSRNAVWEIETGRSGTKLMNLFKLANAFNVEPDYLIKRTVIVYRERVE